MKYFNMKWKPSTEVDLEIKETIKYQKHIYINLRDEKRCLTSEASAYSDYKKRKAKEDKENIQGGQPGFC